MERYPPAMGIGIVADPSQDQLLTRAPQWSSAQTSKRRAELTRRLEALNRTRSILSSGQTLSSGRRSHSEVSSGAESHGTEAAMRALETEIAMLRGVLATMNIRFVEGHVGHMGDGDSEEPLPGYAE
ncbi:hypothetical protein GSI_11128 [Ganoderma sinense ZZ0214-1]|uniref:Uncharacterized protein n=1 Tax=Ganoderma sinense ZZ0214-1 TaxID=1077348 RepID=A0A2G8RZ49_9APHY|nr:hypothetical protein GSI_11128 [Ganoderma sinense ZZ0214-1]